MYLLITEQYAKSHIKEIIYWSGIAEKLKVLTDIYWILQIASRGNINYPVPIDFDLTQCFGEYADLVEKHVGAHMPAIAYYYYEMQYAAPVQNPSINWNKNTIGHANEKTTIENLNCIYGYEIERIGRRSYIVPDTNITISGTPDGIIQYSPGGVFNGCIVEIKYNGANQSQTPEQIERNCTQIATYSKIFDADVLLIVFCRTRYNIYRYTRQVLNRQWDERILPRLISATDDIRSKVFIDDPADVPEYLKMI